MIQALRSDDVPPGQYSEQVTVLIPDRACDVDDFVVDEFIATKNGRSVVIDYGFNWNQETSLYAVSRKRTQPSAANYGQWVQIHASESASGSFSDRAIQSGFTYVYRLSTVEPTGRTCTRFTTNPVSF